MILFRFRTIPPAAGQVGTADAVVCDYCREWCATYAIPDCGVYLLWANPQRTMRPVLECQCGHPADCEPIDHKLTRPWWGREATADEYTELGYDYQRDNDGFI